MGERVLYPVPNCPKCGNNGSIVRNTAYTEDLQIIRYRECKHCKWRHYTSQPIEALVDISSTIVQVPKYTSGNKTITLKSVSIDRQRSASTVNAPQSNRRHR